MSSTDESENLSDQGSEHINPNGWRVISNPTRPPDSETGELKSLIQAMKKQRVPGRRKIEETEPPEAA